MKRRSALEKITLLGGTAGISSSLLNLRLIGDLSAAGNDLPRNEFRALVCVFLEGGNDSFNMLTPYNGDARSIYEETRGTIALPQEDFVALPSDTPSHSPLGLHKNMPNLHRLFSEGSAAFVANIGTLIEPTAVEDIANGTVRYPSGLFSHLDQYLQWQSSLPDNRAASSGWGGRMADHLSELNEFSNVSMNISLAGNNLFQSGEQTAILSKSIGSFPGIAGWNNPSLSLRKKVVTDILNADYPNIFESTFADQTKNSIEAAEAYRSALLQNSPMESSFNPANSISRQLEEVAQSISARERLGKCRQTFFVKSSGWDHHFSLASHPSKLAELDQAIGEFQSAMTELGLAGKVTLFTASDFGRTLTPNFGGSDHGWGGNQFVVGEAVEGKKIYGEYPDLTYGNPLDVGRGRLLPTTSVDEYFADLALWMGVSPTNLNTVLPNLHRFHDAISSGAPLGLFT